MEEATGDSTKDHNYRVGLVTKEELPLAIEALARA